MVALGVWDSGPNSTCCGSLHDPRALTELASGLGNFLIQVAEYSGEIHLYLLQAVLFMIAKQFKI